MAFGSCVSSWSKPLGDGFCKLADAIALGRFFQLFLNFLQRAVPAIDPQQKTRIIPTQFPIFGRSAVRRFGDSKFLVLQVGPKFLDPLQRGTVIRIYFVSCFTTHRKGTAPKKVNGVGAVCLERPPWNAS